MTHPNFRTVALQLNPSVSWLWEGRKPAICFPSGRSTRFFHSFAPPQVPQAFCWGAGTEKVLLPSSA
jgi:hypothetical protein